MSCQHYRHYTTEFRPRLDYARIANHASSVQDNMLSRKHCPVNAHHIKSLYERRLAVYNTLTDLRAQRNQLSKEAKRAAANKDTNVIEAAKRVKQDIKQNEAQLAELEQELLALALQVPNDTHQNVPSDTPRVLKIVGHPREEDKLQDHVTIAQRLGLIDFEQAAIASGSSFYYLQGYGAFLETALIQYAMHKAAERGYLAVMTPDIVRNGIVEGCGFQPRSDESSQIYRVRGGEDHEQLCLAGTAEIPLAGKFAGRLLDEATLPQRLVGFGHAFRAEAGGRGTETKGLYRVHQFSKVELFAVTTPDQSEAMIDEFKELQEEMYTELGLCFRILDMPPDELGASAYRKYDMEAWMPGRRKWGEISSTSNCTDYQSRRLNIRYRPTHHTGKNTLFCHTVNGTAIAVPRIIIAILETFQKSDGSVEIPSVLRPYLPGQPNVLK